METRFEFRDFIKVFASAILLYLCFTLLVALVPGGADFLSEIHPSLSFLLLYLIQFVVFFFPLWIFVIGKHTAQKEDFGLLPVPLSVLVKTVLKAYAGYFAFMLGISLVLTILGLQFPGFESQESYLPVFGNDLFGILIAFFVVVLIAPVIEEILFRGFIYRIFVKSFPKGFGNLLSALLFALVHVQFQTFVPLFVLGLILNYCYQKTGSIWTSIAFHSMNNLLAFAVQIYIGYNEPIL